MVMAVGVGSSRCGLKSWSETTGGTFCRVQRQTRVLSGAGSFGDRRTL